MMTGVRISHNSFVSSEIPKNIEHINTTLETEGETSLHQEYHKLLTALICLRTVLTSLIIVWYLISVLKHLAQSDFHFL